MTDSQKAISDTKTILVVEDEGLLRDMVRSILEGGGYRVLEADSGGNALEVWQAQEGKIELLLTDIMLPRGISGLELARRLQERQPHLKIIFTTGRAMRDLDRDAFEKINAQFLQKPYQHNELIQLVKNVLAREA
jgi:CheY-like chemotaxis protein